MLEGLEISIIVYSRLNFEKRFDPEYFQKEYLRLNAVIESKPNLRIGDFAFITDGIHTSIDYCEVSNINLISAASPQQNTFNLSRQVFISEVAHAKNPRTALKLDDVIISTVGTIGNCAVATESILPANSDRHVGIVRINKDVSPYYLSTFLLTKYGRFQTLRESTGNVQLNLFIYKIGLLKVPNLSVSFQLLIEKTIKNGHKLIEQSKASYALAEQTLLETVGLADFNPSTQNTNIKTFAQSFGACGRLDAEYYQPKYEEIEKAIISYSGESRLGNIIEYIDTGEYSESYLHKEAGLKFYIRSNNIKDGLLVEDLDYFVNPENFTKFAKKGDIVTARVGTLGIFGEVQDEFSGAIYSDNVLCFRLPVNFNASVYTLWFNSKLNWELIDRLARGSVQQRLNQETLKDLLVPIFQNAIQTNISQLVQQSFTLQAESERLLNMAKRAVEIAIEQDEAAAMQFIDDYNDEVAQ